MRGCGLDSGWCAGLTREPRLRALLRVFEKRTCGEYKPASAGSVQRVLGWRTGLLHPPLNVPIPCPSLNPPFPIKNSVLTSLPAPSSPPSTPPTHAPHTQCSEISSKVQAMDNASKNAGEMVDKLQLKYNRARQASITTELIEIISGASALEG